MKIRAALLLVVLLLGVSGAAFVAGIPTAHAEPIPTSPTATTAQRTQVLQTTTPGATSATPLPPTGSSLTASGAANPTPAVAGICSSVTGSLACVMSAIMSIFAWFVGVAAILLEFAVYYTVVTMGTYVHGLAAIPIVWATLRDIGNIVLIFGFIAIGIETIIGTSYYGNTSKRLPMLLIVAVLLNFSLFFTEAIIDIGNLFATQFYSEINGGGATIPKPAELMTSGAVHNEGISNAIMSRVGLQSLYGAAATPNSQVLLNDSPIYIGLLGIILFIITAFVLLSLAFILIVRFIVLIFLIIVAPVGFAGLIVPKLEQYAKQWWGTLINQTLTAPVLMLMLYVALKVILDNNFLAGFGGNANGANGYAAIVNKDYSSFGSTTLSFIVAMGLLLGVVVLAKKMSAAGAGAATKLAGALSFGAVSLGMSSTLGVFGGRVLASKRMQAAASGTGLGAAAARYGVRGGRLLSNRTFDLRNTPARSLPGISDAGPGMKLTGQKIVDSQYGMKPYRDARKKEQQEFLAVKKETDFKKAVEEGDVKTITESLSKMSTKQLEELDGIKKGVAELVTNLSPQQFDALMKSDKLTVEERGKIRDARFANVQSLIKTAEELPTGTPAEVAAKKAAVDAANGEIAKISTKEFTHAGTSFLTSDSVIKGMTDDQYDALSKDGVLTPAEKANVDATRKNRYDASKTSPAEIAESIKQLKWNRDRINKLPVDTVTNTKVLDSLGPDALNMIDVLRRGNLTVTQRESLGAYIDSVIFSKNDPRRDAFAAYVTADPRVKRDLQMTDIPKPATP